MDKNLVAQELLLIAKGLLSAEPVEDEEVEDPKFNEKIKMLRMNLTKISRKKRRRLQQFGIGLIRPNATVEELVDALMKVTTAG